MDRIREQLVTKILFWLSKKGEKIRPPSHCLHNTHITLTYAVTSEGPAEIGAASVWRVDDGRGRNALVGQTLTLHHPIRGRNLVRISRIRRHDFWFTLGRTIKTILLG